MRAERRPAIWRDVLDRARLCWPSLLLTHLAYGALGFVLVAPLLAVAQRLLIALAGRPALTDLDILRFVLDPLGLALALVVVAVGIALGAFELGSLMAIGVAARDGHRLRPLAALLFAMRRGPRILTAAFLFVGRVLLLAAPFLALAAGIAWLLLRGHDINYYLDERPPELWRAACCSSCS